MTSESFIELAHQHPPIKDTLQNVNRAIVVDEVDRFSKKSTVKILLRFAGQKLINMLLKILSELITKKLNLN